MIQDNTKRNSTLRIYFIASIIIQVLVFICMQLYTTKYVEHSPNVTLERYGILVTLIGIPVALKLFHDRVKKLDRENNVEFWQKYRVEYFLRSGILWFVYLFNLISLYATGAKNFSFMIIITIFALFLCAPQKAHFDYDKNNNE